MSRRAERGRAGVIFAIVALLVILVIGAGGMFLFGRTQLDPPSTPATKTATVTVAPGESVDALVSDLAARGLIRSSFWFGWYAKLQGLSSKLVSGDFVIDDSMSASYIIQRLESAPVVKTHQLLLAEGLNAAQMAKKVEAAGLGVSADQYIAEVQKGVFTEPFLAGRPAGASLEGFLFPDTYTIPDGATAHDIVQMQLADFAKKAAPVLAGLTPAQLYSDLTVASLVEREAQFDADRPLVASVVFNRIADGDLLQVDSSVLYGLGLTSGGLSSAQLHEDTPYNTYVHTGLPPTPIANPGVSSVTAAVHPASTTYLYYLSDCSGHNHYSNTLKEHEQQIAQFLAKPCGT